MDMMGCCGPKQKDNNNDEYETVRIQKTKGACGLCEEYAAEGAKKPVAVMSCEGGCLRGEIARQAANELCFSLAPEQTSRVCLGGADTGQRKIVREASRVIAVEGCSIKCASRMMAGVIPGLKPEVAYADSLCKFDREKFGINEMSKDELEALGRTVAEKLKAMLDRKPSSSEQ